MYLEWGGGGVFFWGGMYNIPQLYHTLHIHDYGVNRTNTYLSNVVVNDKQLKLAM